MKKKLLSFGIKFLVSFSLLGLLFWMMRDDLSSIVLILKKVNLRIFLLGFGVFLISTCLFACRLKFLLNSQKVRFSWRFSMFLTFIGFFFNNFLPTAAGGDLVKAHYASKLTNCRTEQAYSTVMVDRLSGLMSFVLMANLALLIWWRKINDRIIFVIVIGLALLLSALFLFFFSQRVSRKLTSWIKHAKLKVLYQAINNYRNHPKALFGALLISVFSQVTYVICIWLLSRSLGVELNLGIFFLLVPLISTLSMVPSIGGLGVRESGYVYFLGNLIGREAAFAVSILWLAILFGVSIIGGINYLILGMIPAKEKGALDGKDISNPRAKS